MLMNVSACLIILNFCLARWRPLREGQIWSAQSGFALAYWPVIAFFVACRRWCRFEKWGCYPWQANDQA